MIIYEIHVHVTYSFLSSCRVVWARCKWNEGDILGCCLSISNVTQRCILLKTIQPALPQADTEREKERENEKIKYLHACTSILCEYF